MHEPLLINGYKFDLRLYVIITSFDPLKIYIHSEGLVRLATEPYSPKTKTLRRRNMHLTNYSVNRKSEKYVKNMDVWDRSTTSGAASLDGVSVDMDGVDRDRDDDNGGSGSASDEEEYDAASVSGVLFKFEI